MAELWRECIFGFRQFRRSPGLAASVAITIGLGVGANLAVFALLSDVFLPPTPYRDTRRLVVVENTGPYFFGGNVPEGIVDSRLSFPDFEDVTSGQRSFSSFGAFSDGHISVLTGAERPRAVCRIYVTPGLFDTLGAAPLRGRLLGAADFAADGAPAALVTDGLWRSHFASAPTITSAAIRLDEQPFTIVGVVPASVFGLLQQREGLLDAGRFDRCVVTPIVRGRNGEGEMILTYMRTQRDGAVVRAVGRLRAGQTMASATADLNGLASRIRQQNPSTNAKRGLRPVALDTWRTGEVRELLLMLAAAASLAFLVACANAAGLILTESVRREAELGVRLALGAGPAQLLRVVLVRAVLWALPGALLGFLFAAATLALVRWGATAGADRDRRDPLRPAGARRRPVPHAAGRPRHGRRRRLVDAAKEPHRISPRRRPDGVGRPPAASDHDDTRHAASGCRHRPGDRRRAAGAQHVERGVCGPRLRSRPRVRRAGAPAQVEVPERREPRGLLPAGAHAHPRAPWRDGGG